MAEVEKVIKAIENCIGQPKCFDCPWEECSYEHEIVNSVPYSLMLDALALLKEQEPKPVGKEWNECPNCGKVLSSIEHIHFCGMCGQAVKWE